jgi:hypothetical protein
VCVCMCVCVCASVECDVSQPHLIVYSTFFPLTTDRGYAPGLFRGLSLVAWLMDLSRESRGNWNVWGERYFDLHTIQAYR